MKNLLLVLILFLVSCTSKEHADTWVQCPCIITEVGIHTEEHITGVVYRVKAKEIRSYSYITFRTTYFYEIGDTIK